MHPLHRGGASPTDDTDPAIEAMLIEGYRRMSPSQKLERIRASPVPCSSSRCWTSGVGTRAPTSASNIRLASRRIDPELMLRAFGWDVREAGY